LKPEGWGSLLVQEKYQEENACDKRHPYRILILISIIITKTKVILVIIGATGTISKSFRKYVNKITGKHEVKVLKKTATLGTAHVLRKVLM